MQSHFPRRLAAVLGTALLGACGAEQDFAFEPTADASAPARVIATSTPGASCQVIDFEGFAHGDEIRSVALNGFTAQFAVESFKIGADWGGGLPAGSNNPNNFLRAFDSNVPNGGYLDDWEDIDLIDPPGGTCAACGDSALGKFMVIEDERGFMPWGDYRWGGRITVTGLPAGAWIESFHAVDDDDGEPAIQLFIDAAADAVARSSGLGDGSVELVRVAKTPIAQRAVFQFGTEAVDEITGSGGIDNIVVCTEDTPPPPPPSNPGTGTIGYWKNHPNAWPVEAIVIGGKSYTTSQAIAIMKTSGKGDKTYDMFNQLVAAKLNVEIGNDAGCIAQTIADADAWLTANPLGSNVKGGSAAWRAGEPLHGRLDQYNNGRLCAPHRG